MKDCVIENRKEKMKFNLMGVKRGLILYMNWVGSHGNGAVQRHGRYLIEEDRKKQLNKSPFKRLRNGI